jgi:hypothetical protein
MDGVNYLERTEMSRLNTYLDSIDSCYFLYRCKCPPFLSNVYMEEQAPKAVETKAANRNDSLSRVIFYMSGKPPRGECSLRRGLAE